MTIVTRAPEATFAGAGTPLPRARLPYPTDCLGYFLLGGDDASSRKNRMVAGDDLKLSNGGPVAFTERAAVVGGTRGYRTPFNVTPGAFTAFVIGDNDTQNSDGTNNPPYFQQATGNYSPVGGSGSGDAGYSGLRTLYLGGERPAQNSSRTATANTSQSASSPWVGAQVGFDGFASQAQYMTCLVEGARYIAAHYEEGRALKSFYSDVVATADDAVPFPLYFPWTINGGFSRMSAIAVYKRAMIRAEVDAVYQAMRRDNVARGFRD